MMLDEFGAIGTIGQPGASELTGMGLLGTFHMEQGTIAVRIQASAAMSWAGFTSRGFGPPPVVPAERRATAIIRPRDATATIRSRRATATIRPRTATVPLR
jgi:hypothetical protein